VATAVLPAVVCSRDPHVVRYSNDVPPRPQRDLVPAAIPIMQRTEGRANSLELGAPGRPWPVSLATIGFRSLPLGSMPEQDDARRLAQSDAP
jgi:hypothetical protein